MTLPLAPPDCRSGPGPRSPPPTRGSDARGRMSKGRMQRRRPAHHRRIGHPACGRAFVLVARRRAEIFSDVSVLQPGQRLFLDGSPLPNEVRRPVRRHHRRATYMPSHWPVGPFVVVCSIAASSGPRCVRRRRCACPIGVCYTWCRALAVLARGDTPRWSDDA